MTTLPRELRSALERAILAARRQTEAGARKALEQLAVAHHEPWPTMTSDQQDLRRRLRARGRQLGDRLEEAGTQGVEHLVSECAYEQWHRMLFARFLAECGLLMEPASGVPLSVEECKELARERGVDWISLASTFAQGMLPQIFRSDDAVLEMTLPPEHRQPLEQLLVSLPTAVFLADDSLGWVYQYWQSEAKDAINNSGARIGADQLPAVTQLFTEDYMVEFLLHNTLGAWWAGKLGPISAGTEEEARASAELSTKNGLGVTWTYLRFIHDGETNTWSPAAGTFSGWPSQAKEVKFLDPCMGSGHFLVFALPLLTRLRMEEEALSAAQAVHATLCDSLFGLEVEERCAQIAAFNVALNAWKLAGYQPLPLLHIACSGLAPHASEKDWVSLAGGDDRLKLGMARLHALFKDAPLLGSLINPRASGGDLVEAEFHELQPLLEKALAREAKDEPAHEMVVTARGLAKAAEILSGQYTLVVTNVPYLGRAKQDDVIKAYCERVHPQAKADLATSFVERCVAFCNPGGATGLVTPQNWLFLGTYSKLRAALLRGLTWSSVIRLGRNAFQDMNFWAATTAMVTLKVQAPTDSSRFLGLDVDRLHEQQEKAHALIHQSAAVVSQLSQLANPDARISVEESTRMPLLSQYAFCAQGISPADFPHYGRMFWEVGLNAEWKFWQSTVTSATFHGGRCRVLWWNVDFQEAVRIGSAYVRGEATWGKSGVAISAMGALPPTLYTGEPSDTNTAILIPNVENDLPAMWCFCSSIEFNRVVRKIDQAIKVTNSTLVKVPFDLAHWQKLAAEKFPHGLPKPSSSDPTQWLFNGHPKGSDHPLHVAVARLLGYQWPRQAGSSFLDCQALDPDGLESFGAQDGIACISSVKGEEAAGTRLGALLRSAYGSEWSAAKLGELLSNVGYAGDTLEAWLRDGLFEQHCEVFHQRPFIWHVWDGRKDGFSALVNYHKLTRANLEKLTFAYLGDWIRRQEASVEAGEAGSDARLVAARQLQDELKKILEGEPPYDIFVRWKPIAQQAIGWEPDLNDGVRMNIRPFLMAADVGKKGAGVLRARPNIKWEKDRGKEPSRSKGECPWFWGWNGKTTDFAGGSTFDGNRWNNLHYSRELKMTARKRKGLS